MGPNKIPLYVKHFRRRASDQRCDGLRVRKPTEQSDHAFACCAPENQLRRRTDSQLNLMKVHMKP